MYETIFYLQPSFFRNQYTAIEISSLENVQSKLIIIINHRVSHNISG